MASITDNRGYNQSFKPSISLEIRTERRCNYIIKQFDKENSESAKNVLEIGCGTGEISYLIASKTGYDVLGADLCEPFIEKCNEKYKLPNLNFIELDFNKPDKLFDKKFDYIIGNGILHHLYYNIEESLLNIKKLLKDDGKIIFLEPNLLNPYCYLIFNTTEYFRKKAKLEPTNIFF